MRSLREYAFSYLVNSEFVSFRLSPLLGKQSPEHCDFVAGNANTVCSIGLYGPVMDGGNA